MRRASTRADFAFWESRILTVLQEGKGLTFDQVCLRCGALTDEECITVRQTIRVLYAGNVIDQLANGFYVLHGASDPAVPWWADALRQGQACDKETSHD